MTPGFVRIIAGSWRGRKLPVLPEKSLRPTPDRIRETLFNWLQHDMPQATCLDLFAGTGALGFEALSRGAAQVTLIDNNAKVVQQLSDNINLLDASSRATAMQADALSWLGLCATSFDVIFLDPPFTSDLLQQVISVLGTGKAVHEGCMIYLERSKDDRTVLTLPAHWREHRTKKAGKVIYSLYEVGA